MRFFKTIIVSAFTLFLFAQGGSGPAVAASGSACETPRFGGSWKTLDANEKLLIRLDITETCEGGPAKPGVSNGPMSNPWAGMLGREKRHITHYYELRPFGRCAPANCVWGRANGALDRDGVLTGRFRMFWSTRFIKLTRMGEDLLVRWRIQYPGRKKPDQLGEVRLVRAD